MVQIRRAVGQAQARVQLLPVAANGVDHLGLGCAGDVVAQVEQALLGFGAVVLVAPAVPITVGQGLLIAGAAAFTLLYVPLWRRQYDPTVLTQLLAAGLALGAAILWRGGATVPQTLPWLIGFIVLTIAADMLNAVLDPRLRKQ